MSLFQPKEKKELHTDDNASESLSIVEETTPPQEPEKKEEPEQALKTKMSDEDLDFLSDNFKEMIQTELQKQEKLFSISLKQTVEEELGTQLSKLSTNIEAISNQNQLFDKMYEELQGYKKGFHLQLFKPILTSLIQLNDNLRMILSYQQNNQESKPTEELYILLKNEYENVIFQIEDIVEENGLIKFNGSLAGEAFDPLCQTIKSVRSTDLPAQNKTVSEVLAPGYKLLLEDGKEFMFRKESVEIYKYNTEK